MSYKFVDAGGATVKPVDRGTFNRKAVGDGLIALDETGGVKIKDAGSNTGSSLDDSILKGVYVFQGRQITVSDSIKFDLTSVTDGAKIGFLYSQDEEGKETIIPAIGMPEAEEVTDIDLQTSGMIVFGVIGLDENGNRYLKENRVKKVRSLYELSDLFMHSEHLSDIAVGKEISTRLVNITSTDHGIGPGRYLVVCSIVTDKEAATAPYELKIRFANNADYDYWVKSKESALQVVAIHNFTLTEALNETIAIEAYLWNPNEAMTITDLKVEVFQLY